MQWLQGRSANGPGGKGGAPLSVVEVDAVVVLFLPDVRNLPRGSARERVGERALPAGAGRAPRAVGKRLQGR